MLRRKRTPRPTPAHGSTASGIDIVLTDIVMPGDMDGVDLARWMSVHQLGSLPIVFATAFSGRAAFAEVRRSRDVVTLSKPYSRKALAHRLSRSFRERPQRDDTSLAKT